VINLNVPDRVPEEVRGMRRARLARFGQMQMTIAEAAEDYVRMSIKEEEARPEPGTDLTLLLKGWATVTPHSHDHRRRVRRAAADRRMRASGRCRGFGSRQGPRARSGKHPGCRTCPRLPSVRSASSTEEERDDPYAAQELQLALDSKPEDELAGMTSGGWSTCSRDDEPQPSPITADIV
jgi:hypothetical protein